MKSIRLGLMATACTAVVALGACENMVPKQRPISAGHVSDTPQPTARSAAIPKPVTRSAYVPLPEPAPPVETYTVVVNEVPIKELVFALARDASVNVDIHPDVEGLVTLNAVDQTLPQILDRIANQAGLRYRVKGDNIMIGPDTPFLRTYTVDYVNMGRDAKNRVKVSTSVVSGSGVGGDSGGGGSGEGGATSETTLDSTSNNQFWTTLTESVRQMLASEDGADSARLDAAVIANPEAGVLLVRATAREHEMVQRYVDQVLNNARRQVLIEATIVEVELNDRYEAGIDWAALAENAGLTVIQGVVAGGLTAFGASVGALPTAALAYSNARTVNPDGSVTRTGDVQLIAQVLKTFGNTKVLSSPKIMAINNQTAVLQVTENIVYFEVETNTTQAQTTAETNTTTTPRTVPVGVILAVTPQIDGADQVTLNVRPTISRVTDFVSDPNPDIAEAGQVNLVPQIAVREMESVLRVGSGQLAVLGGLMQDQVTVDTDDVPVLSEIPNVGESFRFRSQSVGKSELVIFLRPWVIRTPDVDADLIAFRPYLPANLPEYQPAESELGAAIKKELSRPASE